LSRAGVRIQFCFFDSVPHQVLCISFQFSCRSRSSVLAPGARVRSSKSAPVRFCWRFFLFLLRFLQLVFSASSSVRSAHVSEPKCVAEILSAQAVRPALFSRCRSSVSTASFLVSFRRGFARPTSILTSVHARVRSSCQGPVFSLSSAAGFSGSAPGHTSSHCSRFSVLSPAQDLGFGFAVLSFVSCSRVLSAISATLLLLLAQSVVFLCNRIKSS
jgi:hypothetical protein